MATTGPTFGSGGGIVTVPDGTGGAGAPVTVTEIINAMWENSQLRSMQGDLYIDQARADVGAAPQMGMVHLDTSYLPPTAPPLPPMNPNDGEAIYDEKLAQIAAMIDTAFTQFIATYFPNTQGYLAARAST
jgi:hypothetical protein